MKSSDIRTRMLLAALLPVVLVSLLLSSYFVVTRFDDLLNTYQQRTRLVVRQLAFASEYGLFSGNVLQLQALVNGAVRESDVSSAVILNNFGQIQVKAGAEIGAGVLDFSPNENARFDAVGRLDWLVQPVFASTVKLDDLYESAHAHASAGSVQLGQVVMVFSRRNLDQRKLEIVLLGSLISIAGLLFGIFVALLLSRGLILPIVQISKLIERVGHGDFSIGTDLNLEAVAGDPLQELQTNLKKMVLRLTYARDDLEQQVAKATLALREKKEEAEMANQAKSRFLAAASHDLRQPTQALGLFVARLAQLPHDQQTGQLIGNLEDSVRAMQNLLDGLLDISRLDAHAVQVNLQPIRVMDIFKQLQLDLAQTAQDKGLRLRFRRSAVWVLTDPTLLYRILLNLVGNALRYTEKGGVLVACRVADAGRQVRVEVWDSGIGIASEHMEFVFKEFYQVANPARDRNKGMGLGLNIVQRTSLLLGHPLQVSSRVGIGTRFTLTLPCTEPQTHRDGSTLAELPVSNDLTGVYVLVIEDDSLVREALAGLLESWGMVVCAVEGLSPARQHLAQGLIPALIISDYRLKDDYNGIEVVRQVRASLGAPVPACLMSGDTDPELLLAARAEGLVLLPKPARPAKLRSLLRRLLAG